MSSTRETSETTDPVWSDEGSGYQIVLDWGDATPDQWETILTRIAEIVTSRFENRAVDTEELTDCLETLDLNGRVLDLGPSFTSPAMLMIDRYARAVRRRLTNNTINPYDTLLFAIHVEGPDDIIPMFSRDQAFRKVTECNTAAEEYTRQQNDKTVPTWQARVVFWPGYPSDHSRELARLRKDDPDGWLE